MNYPLFVRSLPELYENWGQEAVRPKSPRFDPVLARVRGMTTPAVLQLLNLAVSCLAEGEIYLEVGCFQGTTLVGALLGNTERRAIAIDNFSQFNPDGKNAAVLAQNLRGFGMEKQVEFRDGDFEDHLPALRSLKPRAGVYFYDGGHDYRSQLQGLHLAVPLLSDQALIVVDDSNYPAVKQATWDFLAARPECFLLFDLPTPANCHPGFWNGLHVLGWDREVKETANRPQFRGERQAAFLESLGLLQRLNLRRKGSQIEVSQVPERIYQPRASPSP